MRPARRLLSFSLVMVTAAPLGFVLASGCRAETGPPDGISLRRSFPQEEAAVLGHGEGFVARDKGFAASRGGRFGGFRRMAVELPRVGSEAIRIATIDGFEAQVREVAAEGEGAAIEKAVAYRRAGGTAYWTAAPDKLEEWLHLTAGKSALPIVWEVQGAEVEQRGENVALVDAEGAARLWVSAPAAFAAGGRPLKPVLRAAANGRIELDIEGDADGEVLVDPAWTTLPPMSAARADLTATLITKGRVLVTGGLNGPAATATAEAYEPMLNNWSPLPPMTTSRGRHTATALDNGDVLVAGGFNGMYLASAEIFSVNTDAWMSISPMSQARANHTATRLSTGVVLVTGGTGGAGAVGSSQMFDYWNGYWPFGAFASTPRSDHTATLLGNGSVLVVGGKGAAAVSAAEVFHPLTGEWQSTNSLSGARFGHTATLLFDGRVLVAGGVNGAATLATAEIYEPGTEKWTPAASLIDARSGHAAVVLGNGKVLVTGGSKDGAPIAQAELYDPGEDVWLPAGIMSEAREGHTATVLGDGRVLIAGGKKGNMALASAEMFEPLPLASACIAGSDCLSGFCSDGVCCNEACAAGPCDACSVAAGGQESGICSILNGKMCNDGDGCTVGETCQMGVCGGGKAIACDAAPVCKTAACDPATGKCVLSNEPDGMPCSDNNSCSEQDMCAGGQCKGTERKCLAFDLCHEAGACDPKNGQCSDPEKADCELPEVVPPKPTVPEGAVQCASAEDCPSGFCQEGVCCDSECKTPCHSCLIEGSIGTCTPVPFGQDPLHHCGRPEDCMKTCSGTGDGKCVDAAAGTVCAPGQCFPDGIHGAIAGTCEALGEECPRGERVPFNCSPYRCNPTFGACNTSCSKILDCAEPYVCSPEGQCVAAPAISSGYASSCSAARPGSGGGGGGGSSFAGGLALLVAALSGAARARRRESPRPSAR